MVSCWNSQGLVRVWGNGSIASGISEDGQVRVGGVVGDQPWIRQGSWHLNNYPSYNMASFFCQKNVNIFIVLKC